MTWILGSLLVILCTLKNFHIVNSKQGDGSASSRCVTRRRPHDMRTTRSDLDRPVRIESRARDTLLIRGVRWSLTILLARGCKRWHPLAPGRRYGVRRSLLSEYMSLHLSLKLCTPFENKMREREREREIFIKKCVSFR